MTNKINLNFLLIFLLTIVFLFIFVIEVIFFLPSPTGDDLWFLKLTFNICRDNSFVATDHSIFNYYSISLPWTTHGWLGQYVSAKLNLNCSIRALFLISFFTKLLTSLTIYLIFKKNNLNSIYKYFLIFFTLVVQLKLQFRPEAFCILIYFLLIYNFTKNNFFTSGIILTCLFFIQPSIFIFVFLFGIIIFFKKILKNLTYIFIGILISLVFILYIYPYSLEEFVLGLWNHRSANLGANTFLESGFSNQFKIDFLKHYLLTTYLPFFSILFFLTYMHLIFKDKLLILLFPFVFFFGLNIPTANYNIISITPFCLFFSIFLYKKKISYTKFIPILISFSLIVSSLGFAQYFLRNSLTALKFSNEFNLTKKFLLMNINNIDTFPGFAFLMDEKLKFVSIGSDQDKKIDRKLKVFAINGLNPPCNQEMYAKNNYQPVKIFSKKIFNSNSGYGIWLCK